MDKQMVGGMVFHKHSCFNIFEIGMQAFICS